MEYDLTNITGRVSRPYVDISSAIVEINYKVGRILVCQHDADEEVNRDHIHLLFYNSLIKQEAVKRTFKRTLNKDFKGNKDWSFVETLPSSDRKEFWIDGDDPVCRDEEEIFKYIKYIIKGKKENIRFSFNIGQPLIDKATEAWTTKTTAKEEKLVIIERVKKIPYQQEVIAITTAEWIKYKKEQPEDRTPEISAIIPMVCKAMREVNRGINPYIVKDIAYAVLFDDLDFRDVVLRKIEKIF